MDHQHPQVSSSSSVQQQQQQSMNKYAELLEVLEAMGRDIRPTYTSSKSASERLKRAIAHARILVRECIIETEQSGRIN